MKLALVLACALVCAFAAASQPPHRPQAESLQEHLHKMEARFQGAAAGSNKLIARMKAIDDQMDKLIQSLHALRLQLEGKAGK